jgi:hypothetical protein
MLDVSHSITVVQEVRSYELWSVRRLTKLFQIKIFVILKSIKRNMIFLRYVAFVILNDEYSKFLIRLRELLGLLRTLENI